MTLRHPVLFSPGWFNENIPVLCDTFFTSDHFCTVISV